MSADELEKYLFIKAEHSGGTIKIFCRNSQGKKEIKTVLDFTYYFYVREEEEVPEHPNLLSVESGFEFLFGDKLKKISMLSPADVGGTRYKEGFREKFSEHFEADIQGLKRFLIDTGIRKYFWAPKRKEISWKEIKVEEKLI